MEKALFLAILKNIHKDSTTKEKNLTSVYSVIPSATCNNATAKTHTVEGMRNRNYGGQRRFLSDLSACGGLAWLGK